ncbi:hypothetical protein [Leptospira alexanderi]|uniref:hypothetical protein n=1 Tax=Leptospira alexanderi TaxID=100053 RepID=UPI001FD24640|nr:hypothetical protein [Leptospira alexanderi]
MLLDLNSKQIKRLQNVLERELNYAKDKPYRMERIVTEIYTLFEKFGQSKEGIDLLNSHIEHSKVRKIFINQAILKNQFLHAEKLILKGIQIAKKEKK